MHNEVVKENSKSAPARPHNPAHLEADGTKNNVCYETNPSMLLKTHETVF